MKILIATGENSVLMLAQVLENLVTQISSCDLACGQAAGPSLAVTVRQKDNRLSKYEWVPICP